MREREKEKERAWQKIKDMPIPRGMHEGGNFARWHPSQQRGGGGDWWLTIGEVTWRRRGKVGSTSLRKREKKRRIGKHNWGSL